MRSILAATDLTPDADATLRAAARLAAESEAELHVVYAMGLIGLTLREALGPLEDGSVGRAGEALEEQVRRAIPPGLRPASRTVDYRDPAGAIAALAGEVRADLVVVGAGTAPHVAGLAARAGVPVLVVETPPPLLALP